MVNLKHIVEAVLFASDRPMSLKHLQAVFPELEQPDPDALTAVITELMQDYADRPIELKKVASGYRFQVKAALSPWVARLFEEKPPRYSRALLETLAIIAYRQPVTRGEIEDIRGVVVSSNIIRTLLEREWVKVVAHKEVPGRPALYATTQQLLDYFNLESLTQLPTLQEIQELNSTDKDTELTPQADREQQKINTASSEATSADDARLTRKKTVTTGKHAGKQQRTPQQRTPSARGKTAAYPPAETSLDSSEVISPMQRNAPRAKKAASAPDTADSSERIQKVLARGGIGSRREIERWINEERLKINGQIAKLGDRLAPGDHVYLNGRPVMWEKYALQPTRVIIYHKPTGEVVSRKDPQGRPLVFSKLPKLLVGRWISVGRLDINTSGLLLLTNNGELANRLMHPASIIDREYAVRVLGEVSEEVMAKLKEGVILEDGPAKFSDIALYGGDGANKWYHVTVCEGRNRLVRRLWEAVGVTVSRLMRVRYGPVFLPKGLKTQDTYEMTPTELDLLLDYVGLPKQKVFNKPERH